MAHASDFRVLQRHIQLLLGSRLVFSGSTFCLLSTPLSSCAPGLCPVAHSWWQDTGALQAAHLSQEPQSWAAPRAWAAPSLTAACCILPPWDFLLPTEGLECTLGLKCSLHLAFVVCDPRMNSGSWKQQYLLSLLCGYLMEQLLHINWTYSAVCSVYHQRMR